MKFNHEKVNNVHIIEISEDIYTEGVGELRKVTQEILSEEKPLILFSFTPKVDFICSAGIGLIASTFKEAEVKGGKIAVSGINENIKDIFQRVKLLDVISTFDSKEEAIKFLSS